MKYGFDNSLAESRKELIELKEKFGYDNVTEFKVSFDISDKDLIMLHWELPEKNLRNALEQHLDVEDYRSAEVVQGLLNMRTQGLDEIVILGYRIKKKNQK